MTAASPAPQTTCLACGAPLDERQAWHRWPHHMPPAGGEYVVLLQLPDTRVILDFAQWEPGIGAWQPRDDRDTSDPWPIAWRPLPPLPEWVQ